MTKNRALFPMLLITGMASAQPAPQTILFVCEHGAAKSVVAAAHFNKLAQEHGLPFRAISRGTAPDAAVPSRIRDGLAREGLNLPGGFSPSLVTVTDVRSATRLIMFDVTLPIAPDAAHVQRWDNLPAFSDGYDTASEALRQKLRTFVQELELLAKKK